MNFTQEKYIVQHDSPQGNMQVENLPMQKIRRQATVAHDYICFLTTPCCLQIKRACI